jgi:hypothetical protein
MADSRTYPLLHASGEAIVDLVEAAAARRPAGIARRPPSRTRNDRIRLHDTMAREKRAFAPADPKRVTMYVCGPTVYNRAHIGNARPAVIFDVLARLLREVYGSDSLNLCPHVTDVDDKIIEAAKAEGGRSVGDTDRYERFYNDDMVRSASPCRRSRRTRPSISDRWSR